MTKPQLELALKDAITYANDVGADYIKAKRQVNYYKVQANKDARVIRELESKLGKKRLKRKIIK